MSLREWDLIGEYIGLMENITDAPREFQEAAALFLVSSFIGKNFVFLSLPEAPLFNSGSAGGFGGKNLNLWFILIGKSRVSRKSTVVGRAEEVLDMIDASLKLPMDFTPQALVQVMKRMSDGKITRASWINDECSGFFEQLRKTDFMVTADTVMSRMYDGRSYKRTTVGRGEERVDEPFITVLLSSTEHLPGLFDVGRIRQGFLNRFIFIPAKRTRNLELRTNLNDEERTRAEGIISWLRALYTTTQTYVMNMTTEAKDIYNEYEREIDKDIMSGELGVKEGYRGNLPNFLVRIACIYRVARMSERDLLEYNRPVIVVEKRDVDKAIEYVEEAWTRFEQVISMMRTSASSRMLLTEENKLEMVFRIINDSEDKKATRTQVYRQANLIGPDLDNVIGTLIRQGRVKMRKQPGATKSTTYYEVVEGG